MEGLPLPVGFGGAGRQQRRWRLRCVQRLGAQKLMHFAAEWLQKEQIDYGVAWCLVLLMFFNGGQPAGRHAVEPASPSASQFASCLTVGRELLNGRPGGQLDSQTAWPASRLEGVWASWSIVSWPIRQPADG